MDHNLELFIPILEILEIEVCNILCKPGNIGKHIFSTQFYLGNSGSYDPYISPTLEILDRTSILSPILEILDRTIHTQSYPGNIGSYDPYLERLRRDAVDPVRFSGMRMKQTPCFGFRIKAIWTTGGFCKKSAKPK